MVTDAAQILRCSGYGIGWRLQLQFNPASWELPSVLSAALKEKKKNRSTEIIKSEEQKERIMKVCIKGVPEGERKKASHERHTQTVDQHPHE